MIKGTGADILEIKRISDMSKKMGWTLAHRTLGHDELEVYSGLENKVMYLARRFAAKEAIIKAFGGQDVDMRDFQVLNEPDGRPYVLHKGQRTRNLHVSISDCGDYVMATAVLEE